MASAVGGYTTTFGKDEPMGCYEDIDHADVFFIIGSNTAEAHPVLWDRIMRRKRGNPDTKLIVADPRRTPTARAADLYISFIPGMDLAILNAIANVMVAENLVVREFIRDHVAFGEGAEVNQSWESYAQSLAEYTPTKAAAMAECRAEDIVQAARWFGARNRATMSMWTMGLNQRTRGVWVNNLVNNLHLITGKIGTPGSTPMSLTGQPNACGGVRDGGALAPLLPYGRSVTDEKHRAEIEKLWAVPPGTIQAKPGLFTVDMFRALEQGKLKALYVMCTNLGQSLPSVGRYRRAMQNSEAFMVVTETFHPTRTSELASVVLPAALWAEKEGVYGCTERRYQLLAKAVEPLGEARPDLDILLDFGRRLGFGQLLPFKTPEDVWNEILKLCKGTAYDFSGMTRERLRKAHGLLWPMPSLDHPGTKRRYVKGDDPLVPADHSTRMKFYGRADGKAVVWIRPQSGPDEKVSAEFPFVYTTTRVLEHWHTGTMTRNVKELRHANAEALAEINPTDGQKLGIRTGDRVRITSKGGQGEFRAMLTDTSRAGLVAVHMHDPNHMCNVVTNDAVDPISRQPEFKVAAVRLEKV